MHRRLILPLALLFAFVLGAIQGPALQPAAAEPQHLVAVRAVPPPPSGIEQAALLSASAPIQWTEFDVRFHAVVVDGAGQVFVAVPYPGSKIRICRLVGDRLEPFYDLPGEKHASVALAVLQDGDLLVSWSSRPPGDISGPFPLMAVELPGVATPQPRFGVAMPMVSAP